MAIEILADQLYKKYRLSRINLVQHPVTSEDYLIRRCYLSVLYAIAKKDSMLQGYVENSLMAYRQIFAITDQDYQHITQCNLFRNSQELEQVIKVLRKTYYALNRQKIEKKHLKYILIANIFYLYGVYNKGITEISYVRQVAKLLRISSKEYLEIFEFMDQLSRHQYDKLNLFFKKSKYKLLNYFYNYLYEEDLFERKPEHNVLVIANMSAGKSTLINSLVGHDLLPAKNEACTAKVINLCHNNFLDRAIGYATGNKEYLENIVSNKILRYWNEDNGVWYVHIETNFPNMPFLNKKLNLIDTPGTNNSANTQHGLAVDQLLKRERFDTIIYILNGTNLSCDDDLLLLKKIQQYCQDNKRFIPQLIFLVNKMDQFDVDKENLSDVIANTVRYIKLAGIEKPVVLAVSAYAARLLKTALNGGPLTKKETKDFRFFYELFQDKHYDLTKYCHYNDNFFQFLNVQYDGQPHMSNPASELLIDNKVYQTEYIIKALNYTGILQLEKILHNLSLNPLGVA